MPARSSTPESARVCSSAENTGLRSRRARSATSATSASKRSRSTLTAIDGVLLARELEQRGRVAARHAGNDCVFACHVDLLFRQFRRLGTVADGGRQALEIQCELCIFAESAGAPRKPTKIARLRNTPPTAVQHDEMPAGNARFANGRPLRERPAPMVHRPSPPPRPAGPRTCHASPRIKLPTRPPASCWSAVSLAWGVSWPAMKIALNDIPPFSMRVGTSGLATVVLFTLAFVQHRRVRISDHGRARASGRRRHS